MNFKTSECCQTTRISRSVVLAAILMLFSFGYFSTAKAQISKLSLTDVVTVLRSKKATIEEKNKLLTQGIRERGTTFSLNEEIEKELRLAGANSELLQAIREKNPSPKPVVQKIEPPAPVVQRQPDYVYYQNRGNSSFVLGEYGAAIAEYSKAVELNPKESSVYLSRGLAYFNQKGYNAAIADFNKVIELDPKESIAYFNRAGALEKVGEFDAALRDFSKAAELDAENDAAKSGVVRVQTILTQIAAKNQSSPNQLSKNPVQNAPENEAEKLKEPVETEANLPANVGALNSFAVDLVKPQYPPYERQKRTEGLVTVQISLDEDGKILSVKAVSGPKTLRNSAEDAARRTKFNPVKVAGKSVKANGFINYNFKFG